MNYQDGYTRGEQVANEFDLMAYLGLDTDELLGLIDPKILDLLEVCSIQERESRGNLLEGATDDQIDEFETGVYDGLEKTLTIRGYL